MAHGGERADQQAHIGMQQTRKPGPAGNRQHAGLGAQVGGNHGLDFARAIGQLAGDVGRQLVAQLEHGARQIVQQFLVLLWRLDDIPAGVGQGAGQQGQRREHHHRGGNHLRPVRQIAGYAAALQPRQQPGQGAREHEADADAQQAGQQALPHDQQQGAGHQQIAGVYHAARRCRGKYFSGSREVI
ncbi:hypothetical protein D3C71_1656850 [compost metagenome]